MEPGETLRKYPGSTRFVIPWRAANAERQNLWDHCSAYWARECPEIEQHTADSRTETFSRAAAINLAASGSWDVAVVLDADVIAPGEQVYAAVEQARASGQLTLGFTHYTGLTPLATRKLLEGYDGELAKLGHRYKTWVHESSIVAVPRELWDRVGGFDERFVGWSQEDVAFCHAARILGGEIHRIPGEVYHLWHARSPARDPRREDFKAAQALGARYRAVTNEEELGAVQSNPAPVVKRPDLSSIARVAAFTKVYRGNRWNGTETRSGPGSGLEATATLANVLPSVCAKYEIASVLDAGCGEGLWQPHLPGYIGVDLVKDALIVARRTHPDRTYESADICRDGLPKVDAILCRDALQHLPLADAQDAIANFRRSGARYLIASSHAGEPNRDVAVGEWYACNLEAPPFSLGKPLWELFDGRWAGQDRYPNKMIGLWSL